MIFTPLRAQSFKEGVSSIIRTHTSKKKNMVLSGNRTYKTIFSLKCALCHILMGGMFFSQITIFS